MGGVMRHVIVLALALWLAACSQPSPLVLVGHPFAGYAPAWVAQTVGLWPADQVVFEPTRSSLESTQRLRTGQAQAALLTLDEAQRLHAEGVPLSIVLVVDRSVGADVVLAHSHKDASSLAGRRLGFEAGGVSEFLARAYVAQQGGRWQDIQPVDIPYPQQEAAWREGRVDLLATFHPVSAHLRAAGAVPVFSSRQTPGLIWDVLVVREPLTWQQRRALRRLRAGWFAGLDHLRRYEEDTRWRLSGWLELPPEEAATSLDGLWLLDEAENRRWLTGNPAPLRAVLAAQAARLVHWGLLPADQQDEAAALDIEWDASLRLDEAGT